MGAGFEFSPIGIVPLGTPNVLAGLDATEPSGAVVRPHAVPVAVAAPAPAPAPVAAVARPLSTPNVMQMCRARVKEIDAELKRLKSLEKERAELARILAAGKGTRTKKVAAH